MHVTFLGVWTTFCSSRSKASHYLVGKRYTLCRQDRDRHGSPRIIQHDIINHHDETIEELYCFARSKVKVIALPSSKTLCIGRIDTLFRPLALSGFTGTIHLQVNTITEYKHNNNTIHDHWRLWFFFSTILTYCVISKIFILDYIY
jgi:hypothetical protein